MQIFLRDSWLNTLRTAIRSSLLDVGKGWFNMEERNWEVYQISKLAKFMQLVKFAMQVSRIFSGRDLCVFSVDRKSGVKMGGSLQSSLLAPDILTSVSVTQFYIYGSSMTYFQTRA